MARAPTTLDPFNAVAEPKRRQVLDLLAKGERPVNDLVKALGWPQPQVSKHLGVLRKVGLVSERRAGRQRFYRLNAERLKPIHEWVKNFERFWKHQLERIKARAEQKVQESKRPSENHPLNRSETNGHGRSVIRGIPPPHPQGNRHQCARGHCVRGAARTARAQ